MLAPLTAQRFRSRGAAGRACLLGFAAKSQLTLASFEPVRWCASMAFRRGPSVPALPYELPFVVV